MKSMKKHNRNINISAICLVLFAVAFILVQRENDIQSYRIQPTSAIPVCLVASLENPELTLYTGIERLLPDGEKTSLKINNDGRLQYLNTKLTFYSSDNGYYLTDEQAIIKAKKELKKLGLLPKSDYRITVSSIKGTNLDLTGEQENKPVILEHTIFFYHTYNGFDVLSDDNEGIVVGLNKDGLCRLDYMWRELKVEKKRNESTIPLSEIESLYNKYFLSLHPHIDILGEEILQKSAYAFIKGKMKRVRAFSMGDEYVNTILIDLDTGEVFEF